MGRARGMELLENRDDLSGLFVEENAAGELEVTRSKSFDQYLEKK